LVDGYTFSTEEPIIQSENTFKVLKNLIPKETYTFSDEVESTLTKGES
jgi:hypothetical protein